MTTDQVLAALRWHVGAAYGITARRLAEKVTGEPANDRTERGLRKIIEQLRRDGHHVCGHPAHGYYLAANTAELDQTCLFLTDRAMTSLSQVAAMKRVALPDLHKQLKLPT